MECAFSLRMPGRNHFAPDRSQAVERARRKTKQLRRESPELLLFLSLAPSLATISRGLLTDRLAVRSVRVVRVRRVDRDDAVLRRGELRVRHRRRPEACSRHDVQTTHTR